MRAEAVPLRSLRFEAPGGTATAVDRRLLPGARLNIFIIVPSLIIIKKNPKNLCLNSELLPNVVTPNERGLTMVV